MWCKFCILVLFAVSSARSVKISPQKDVFSVAVGSKLEINCSSPNGVVWSSDSSSAMRKTSESRVEGSVAGSDNISTLTFSNVQKYNQAKYVCKDTTTKANITFQLLVFKVTKQDATYEYKEDAVLNCGVDDDNKSFSYRWKRGNTWVTDIKVDNKQEFVEHDNGSLVIRQPTRNLAGVFTCVAEYEANNKKHTIDIDFNYFAHPKVLPFDKSKNLVQDEKLVIECKVLGYPKPSISWFKEAEPITCKVLGYPKPSISWFKEAEPITEGEGSRFKMSVADTYDGTDIEYGKLVIDAVEFEDAAEYTCLAATTSKWPEFNSTQIILVRVKDKLAALWPFLGIVAEVVVLCTIIFICEKKRNKDALLEEEANQDGASSEKKAEGVRHRGSPNNPRA
ncbi:hypothetical protein ACOMHN_018563 [Nucella lapillus]